MNKKPANEPVYYGPLSSVITKYVAEKQIIGYDYMATAQQLSNFSRFTSAFSFSPVSLPKDIVLAYVKRDPNETFRNCEGRCSLVRGLAEYMLRSGYEAYLLPKHYLGKRPSKYISYIFTQEELRMLFAAADSLSYKKQSCAPRRHLILPVLLRLLYCCGLRISEALNLLGEDVDLDNGILLIRSSKFEETRYVPISEELLSVCRNYDAHRLQNVDPKLDWFFAAPDGGKYSHEAIYHAYRLLLHDIGIPHRGRGMGPRLHDLRHTFAVHNLRKTVEAGEDPTTALPRLSVYMGHTTFQSTEYYLRLTAEVYPQITARLDAALGCIIPEFDEEVKDSE